MGDVTALMMDVITEKSGHTITPLAVSVCITPAAPAPLPLPYPVVGSSIEGIADEPMRTRINGAKIGTTGSVLKTCHGNEPGTLKEVVSLNTAGPCFIIVGAPTVLCELGMLGITGSPCMSNKAPTAGAGSSASSASGTGGAGGGGGEGSGSGGDASGPQGPAGGGGAGGGGSNSGAAGPGKSTGPPEEKCTQAGHPVDVVSGNVVDTAFDFVLTGLIPVVWDRRYSSARRTDENAPLGPGWALGFHQWMAPEGDTLALHDGDGRTIFFEPARPGETTFHRRERLRLTVSSDGSYRVYSVATQLTRVFSAAASGEPARLRSIRDAHDNAIVLEYEGARLVRLVDTAGREVSVRWKQARIVRVEVRAEGRISQWVDYTYSSSGCLASAVDALGRADEYESDRFNRITSITLKNGVCFQYVYEANTGRCAKTWGPKGLYALELTADRAAHTTVLDGEEPRIFTWNDDGLVIREATLDGAIVYERAYDEDSFLIAETNGAGEGSQLWYDAHGNLIRGVDAGGNVTAWEYDAHDHLVKETTPDGVATTYGYDTYGSLVAVARAPGLAYAITYDDRGRRTAIVGASGTVRAYEYDAANNITAETDARGARWVFTHDAMGRPLSSTDALGRTRRVGYDLLGRDIVTRRPDGTSTSSAYDALDLLAKYTDPLGQITKMEYGGTGVLTRVEQPDGRVWTFSYTGQERLAAIKNPRGEVYAFTYDDLGRVVQEKSFDGRILMYHFDVAGRLDRVTYPDGTWRAFSHDRMGNLVGDDSPDGTIRYPRDRLGRLVGGVLDEQGVRSEVRFELDELGRLLADAQGDRRVRYAYDARGRRTGRTMPDGKVTRYDYDAADALVAVEHLGHRLEIERDVLGREVRKGDAAGRFAIHSVYDAMDRIVEQRAVATAPMAGVPAALVQRQWSRDAKGRVKRIDDARFGATVYAYDKLGQLLDARRGSHREAFGYDVGEALVKAIDGLDADPRREAGWEIAPGDLLLKTKTAKYTYDKRGRRIVKLDLGERGQGAAGATEYVWDCHDQLREVRLPTGARVRMTYDAFGRRLRKEILPADGRVARTVDFVWEGDTIAADLDSERGLRTFVHLPGTQIQLLQEERGEVLTVVHDHLGMPRELIDPAGQIAWAASHSAWGAVTETYRDLARGKRPGRPVESPFRLVGQYADEETGLAATRFRQFDPEVGRWLSPDALGFDGGHDLFGFNGSPSSIIDPLGLTGLNDDGHMVYGLYHEGETKPYYIGITNDKERREKEHKDNDRMKKGDEMHVMPGSENLKYKEARGHEQALMEHHGTKPPDKKGKHPGNVVNSFDHKRADDKSDKRGKAFEKEYQKKKKDLATPPCQK
jgi:RHS repeat-associated protein